jgi:hypothetical protein
MSLSITRLPTHWDAGEAYTVIAFLDLLRDQLWETYGEQITGMLQEASTAHPMSGSSLSASPTSRTSETSQTPTAQPLRYARIAGIHPRHNSAANNRGSASAITRVTRRSSGADRPWHPAYRGPSYHTPSRSATARPEAAAHTASAKPRSSTEERRAAVRAR